MRNRPWVEKFETGEYLRKWNGYKPHILGCTSYSEHIGIGEDKFFKCVGEPLSPAPSKLYRTNLLYFYIRFLRISPNSPRKVCQFRQG
jgi:hypothetical protein